jgi:hypothetical protein
MNLRTGACAYRPDAAGCEKKGNEILWPGECATTNFRAVKRDKAPTTGAVLTRLPISRVEEELSQIPAQVEQSTARRGRSTLEQAGTRVARMRRRGGPISVALGPP